MKKYLFLQMSILRQFTPDLSKFLFLNILKKLFILRKNYTFYFKKIFINVSINKNFS